MRVRELSGESMWRFLETHWPMLYHQDKRATPYQSPGWLTGWAQQLPPTAVPVLLVVESLLGVPTAAIAMVRGACADGRATLRPLSAPYAEYVRPVGPDSEKPAAVAALVRLLTELARQGDCVLPDIPADTCLGRHLASHGFWQHTSVRCASIPLPVDYASMSGATRKDHRRRARRWDELWAEGRAIYHRTATTAELVDAYPLLDQLYQRRWNGADATTGGTAEEKQWLSVLAHCGGDVAFIATLTLDDVLVAAQL